MADEVSYAGYLSLTNGGLTYTQSYLQDTDDQTTARRYGDVQNIGTTHEALALGSISTPGWCFAKNLDATNFVQLGVDVSAVFYPFVTIPAGGTAGPFKLGATAPYAKADTAAVELDFIIFEA